jgi:hypothetical protein
MKISSSRRFPLPHCLSAPLPHFLVIVCALVVLAGAPASAHDIPADVLVNMFVKPEGNRLRLLVRVPLGAMRDMNLPLHGPAFMNLPAPESVIRDAARLWIAQEMQWFEDGRPLPTPTVLATQISLPSDKAFTSYDDALAHINGPRLPDNTELVWNQALLDVLLEAPITSADSRLSVRPALARLGIRTVTVVRFLPPGGGVRAFEYTGDPGLVRLDPSAWQAAAQFVGLGFEHILSGIDHLLFLLCLVIPFRRFGQLVLIVTSFTVAHSVTLIASALNFAPTGLWFPPLVETLIAMSILYMALENIVGVTSVHRRWTITFVFGLVHGFGFSFALRQTLQFAGSHMLSSLVAFNVGVELGQLLVLAIGLPVLYLVFRYVTAERMGTIILSAFIAHTAWHWTLDRGAALREFGWPEISLGEAATLTRWAMGLVLIAAVIWLARRRAPARQTSDRSAL